jgi:hypothetical protein
MGKYDVCTAAARGETRSGSASASQLEMLKLIGRSLRGRGPVETPAQRCLTAIQRFCPSFYINVAKIRLLSASKTWAGKRSVEDDAASRHARANAFFPSKFIFSQSSSFLSFLSVSPWSVVVGSKLTLHAHKQIVPITSNNRLQLILAE